MVDLPEPSDSELPIFGPNGVVLNAPDMTDEMRREHEEVERTQHEVTRKHMLAIFIGTFCALAPGWLGFNDWLEEQGVSPLVLFAACFVCILAISLVDRFRKRRRPNP